MTEPAPRDPDRLPSPGQGAAGGGTGGSPPAAPAPQGDASRRDTSQQAVQCLTTEHFTLQTGRSATVSDANGRASLFMGAVSSAVVALAFIGDASSMGEAFFVFSLVLLPTLFFLGLVTAVRVLESALEDFVYARGINRIRHFYTELAPELRPYFVLSVNDDDTGAAQNMVVLSRRWQLLLTTSGTIAIINSVIGAVFAGLLVERSLGPPLLLTAVAALAAFALCAAGQLRFQRDQWQRAGTQYRALFPAAPESPR